MTRMITVALFEDRYGSSSIRAFTSMEAAWEWRCELADEWWSDEFPDEIPPEDSEEKADEYFDRMAERREFFTAEKVLLEGYA